MMNKNITRHFDKYILPTQKTYNTKEKQIHTF